MASAGKVEKIGKRLKVKKKVRGLRYGERKTNLMLGAGCWALSAECWVLGKNLKDYRCRKTVIVNGEEQKIKKESYLS